jgi:class 3 adenylate cyclase
VDSVLEVGHLHRKEGSQRMAVLPTKTVTFLFADIEGSTRLWEREASAMKSALARRDEILRSVIDTNGGLAFKMLGDAFCAAFSSAPDARDWRPSMTT